MSAPLPLTTLSPGSRAAATAATVAGLLGAVIAIVLIVVPAAVPESRYSFPFTTGPFTVVQIALGLIHLATAVGVLALWRSGAAGRSTLGAVGAVGSTIALVLLAVGEFAAITVANESLDSSAAGVVDIIYGVASIAFGVLAILLGVAVIRAKVWTGWQRWVVLVLGIYTLVPLLPANAAPPVVWDIAIGVWSLLTAAVGVAILTGRQTADRS